MGRVPRVLIENGYYHVYNRGVEKKHIFHDDQDRQLFLRLLSQLTEKFSIDVYAFCLMTNHYHLYVKTSFPNLDKFLHGLQSSYAKCFNLKYDRVGYLFQNRYKSILVDSDTYSLSLVRYIHLNSLEIHPDLDTYPWSSYSNYKDERKSSWIKTEWVLRQFHPNSSLAIKLFLEFHLNSSTKNHLPYPTPKAGRPKKLHPAPF